MKRIGIMGCGKIAQVRHIPELATNPNAQLAGYYNPTIKRAEQMAQKYGGKVYNSIEELLSDSKIDAVVICLANQAHAEVTIQSLKAGKDVLCEKPMATTIEDCEAMVDAANLSGKKLMIAHNQRLAKAHAKAKELLRKGIIGKILTFRTTFGHGGPEFWSINPGKNTWFFNKQNASLGAMADLGIHKTDLIQYLLGQNIISVSATITTLDKTDATGKLIDVDDNAICIYTMENGVIGTMTASWTYYGAEDNSTVIYGTEGIMRIYENPDYAIQIVTKNGEKIYMDVEPIQTNDNQTKSGIIDLFIDTLEQDKEPEISGKNVLPAMRAIFAAVQSCQEKRTIEIPANRTK